MKTFRAILNICLFTLSSHAWAVDSADFHWSALAKSYEHDDVGVKIECDITQHLAWEDQTSVWQCQFGENGPTQTIMTTADAVGYDYNRNEAYSKHWFSPETELGRFFFKGLQWSDVQNLATIVIYYGSDKPKMTPAPVLIKREAGVYVLDSQKVVYQTP